jgi:hypothetical protein
MLAIGLMDHRLALAALVALLIAAAVPLAYAWARLLPEERPPFEFAGAAQEDASSEKTPRGKDPIAISLLVCVTLGYLLRFPGVPLAPELQWLSTRMPADYSHWLVVAGRAFFLIIPGLAVVYSALRPNTIRIALAAGGLLVLALWLLSPLLQKAIAMA